MKLARQSRDTETMHRLQREIFQSVETVVVAHIDISDGRGTAMQNPRLQVGEICLPARSREDVEPNCRRVLFAVRVVRR